MQRDRNTLTYISQVKYCLKKSVLQSNPEKMGILCTRYDLCGVGGSGIVAKAHCFTSYVRELARKKRPQHAFLNFPVKWI